MIQIDLWGGDLHQNLVQTHRLDDWAEAFDLVQEAAETGLLVNLLHLDFRAPAHRFEEQREAPRKHL